MSDMSGIVASLTKYSEQLQNRLKLKDQKIKELQEEIYNLNKRVVQLERIAYSEPC